MVKLVIHAESIDSVTFPFMTTTYQQDNSDGYFKIEVLNNSSSEVGHTAEAY